MKRNVKKILIVEDDLALKPIWEKFFKLTESDAVLEWAVSCEEAIKLIQSAFDNDDNYFLIITDIFLAGSKTGIQLLSSPEVVKSRAKTVLISAVDRNEIINKYGFLFPQTRVISKPFDFKKYEIVFKEIMRGDEITQQVGA